jgi:hypothetical protein
VNGLLPQMAIGVAPNRKHIPSIAVPLASAMSLHGSFI